MKIQICWLMALLIPILMAAADQKKLGEGNATALRTGQSSKTVSADVQLLLKNVGAIHDDKIREATLDALRNSETCVAHRVRVTEEVKLSILAKLKEEGLLPEGGDPQTGIFPPLRNDGGECPHLPLTLSAAPGSGFGSHHSYPGGLAAHEAFNQRNAMNLAALYRTQYGKDTLINQDWVMGSPAWHDWAKMMVFQWNADGTIFDEYNFGGTGRADNYRAPGDSRTGAHHILGLAETMARGLPPGLVITQASAHAAPTMGNEYKVVNWLRAAALIARIDPAAKGYLVIDKDGKWRLPPLNHLWDGLDLNQNGQVNFLVEYQIHNLSDADFVESIPAVSNAELLLRAVAKQFGYDPAETAVYNNEFRNVVLAMIGPERLSLLYSSYGLSRVAQEIGALGVHHAPN
jgi:hypothetical protein